jgi:hypothetical protein
VGGKKERREGESYMSSKSFISTLPMDLNLSFVSSPFIYLTSSSVLKGRELSTAHYKVGSSLYNLFTWKSSGSKGRVPSPLPGLLYLGQKEERKGGREECDGRHSVRKEEEGRYNLY